MAKLWQQNTEKSELGRKIEQFTVGDDYLLDQRLIPHDVRASKAHAGGLHKIGLLTDSELEDLLNTLDEIKAVWKEGSFSILPEQEDGHTAIEAYLTDKLGETGKKIHTGRSRNDQVLTAMRLYEKEELKQVVEKTRQLITSLLEQAERFQQIPMPGYTHTQRAMLSSVAMWLSSIAEMLLLDLQTVGAVYRNIDLSPLGTAAGFGVNIEIPREWVAEQLGFAGLITVSLTAQNTRGKIDLGLVQAIEAVGASLAHFANDLVWYTSREFGFFKAAPELCTGSSIMPQKQNLDTAEMLRARYSVLSGCEQAIKVNSIKLTSGYHRDLQLIKKNVMTAFDEILAMLEMSRLLVESLAPNKDRLEGACTEELFAADQANEWVKQGIPFREAYHRVKANLDSLEVGDIEERLKDKKHTGGTGNLGIGYLRDCLEQFKLA